MTTARKKFLSLRTLLGLLILLSLVIAACNGDDDDDDDSGGNGESEESYVIGIFNPLNFAGPVEGFQSEMLLRGYDPAENTTYVTSEVLAQPLNPQTMSDDMAALLEPLAANDDIDLLLCVTTSACTLAQAEMSDTPIVFVAVADPVGAGLVQSFADPGANVTGVASAAADHTNEGRRFELLTEVSDDIARVLVIYNPNDPVSQAKLAAVEAVAERLDVELVRAEYATPEESQAIAQDPPEDIDAVFTFSERTFSIQAIGVLTAVTLERDLPYSAPGIEYGALLSYGPLLNEIGAQAARLADEILKGADPSEIPVETAEMFLAIDQGAAQEIGLEMPQPLLDQAHTIVYPEESPATTGDGDGADGDAADGEGEAREDENQGETEGGTGEGDDTEGASPDDAPPAETESEAGGEDADE